MSNRRILVIDDNPAIHDDFRRILRFKERIVTLFEARSALFDDVPSEATHEGFEVDCADQGQAGLALVQSAVQRGCPYAVAFIDMRMPPGWDGVETLEHLWCVDPDLQAVICTAFSDLDWDYIIQRLGRSEQLLILRKPFDVVEVWQMASSLAQKWCLTQQAKQRLDTLAELVNHRTQALREANEQLQRDIAHRQRMEAELQHAKDAAETANHAKSQFLANMSHEIRTPIMGMIGMAEIVLDTNLTSEQQEYLELIKMSADSLLTVINDVLDFSKIEAGKLALNPHAFHLCDTLDNAAWMLATSAHRKGLELICHVLPDVPDALVGDAGRLRQIMINLLSNAIKFTEQGEVVIRAETMSQTEDEIAIHFMVSDTGIGIPEEKQQAIFEAFTQVDSSATRQYGGTGLGLVIAARLVELMGGRLWVESVVGQGSTFHFLARFALQQPLTAQPSRTVSAAVHGLRVLVVDDRRMQQRVLVERLRQWGMQPGAVASGQEALMALELAHQAGEPFALALLDAAMPGMDGFMLTERIKQHPELTVAMVMMLTAIGQPEDATRCQNLGIAASVLKPIRYQGLLRAILTALNLSPQQEELALLEPRPSVREEPQRYRILLAEDNFVNRRILVRLLEKRGHTIAVAESGRKVLTMLEQEPFDLVLMDVQMPEIDGLTVTTMIRQTEQQTDTHMPIIAMTAHAMDGDRERCLEAGMDGYLSKPFHAAELFDAIQRLMSSSSKA